MATVDKMLAAAPLSESEVVAMVKLEPFEMAMIGYAAKKRVSLISSIVGGVWIVTINGFNTTRFNLSNNTIETYMATVMEMVNIVAAKPIIKRKATVKPKSMKAYNKPKIGDMARQIARKFDHFAYIGMWDTGCPGVQIGAKVLYGSTLQEGYFVNGVYCGRNYARACATADYYQEYVGG